MNTISPLEESELKGYDFFFKMVKDTMGFLPNSIKTMGRVPAIMGGFSILSGVILGDVKKAKPSVFLKLLGKQMFASSKLMKDEIRVPFPLRHMVGYVTSRAAGCQYCQAHTYSNVQHSGMDQKKLDEIWSFESSELFTEAERSALRFGIAAGSTPNAVTQEHFTDLKKHFTENQIVELGAVISMFGFLNRWNETFATQLETEPLSIAEKHLSVDGWNVGRHKA